MRGPSGPTNPSAEAEWTGRAVHGRPSVDTAEPVISVVVVSDYEAGHEKGWQDLAETLRALAQQDFEEPHEIILAEAARHQSGIPDALRSIIPDLRIVAGEADSSYALKNAGAAAARADLVGILDGDCVPERSWLRSLVRSLREHRDVSVVSGRTEYAGRKVQERILGMLSRGYLDQVNQRATHSIANNNAGFRKSVLIGFPFDDVVGPFGERLHVEDLRRAGHRFLFDPGMRVVHSYEGWGMERDIRRHGGYAAIKTRLLNPLIAFAPLARLGWLSVLLFLGGRTLYS